jgi:histidyl-tRNA synthetase
LESTTQLLFACFGEEELKFAMQCATELRRRGLRVEVYPEAVKMKRQMAYADAKHIPYVAIIGSNELQEQKMMLKNMLTGEQSLLSTEEVAEAIR